MKARSIAQAARKAGIRALRVLDRAGIFEKAARKLEFRREFRRFVAVSAVAHDSRFSIDWAERYPILSEKTQTTPFDPHYVYHTSWAARLLGANSPGTHCDFSSDIRFATLVSAFIPISFYDYRPLNVKLPGLTSLRADLTRIELPDSSVSSLSCMHVVEHIGLGRYGDRLDSEADLKAIAELKRILAPKGDLYFVVPVGQPKVVFNAHRIYSYAMIMEYFQDFELCEFSLVTDDGTFVRNVSGALADMQSYGCGCFWFKK